MKKRILLCGDIIIFLLFSFLGKLEHGLELTLYSVLYTASPFIVSWLLIVFLVRRSLHLDEASILLQVRNTLMLWIPACFLAMGIRGLLEGMLPSLMFTSVTLGLVFIILIMWRILYIVSNRIGFWTRR